MSDHHPPEPAPRRDWIGALIQGLLGGLVNGTTVGAAGTALRDLAVQDIAHRTADHLRHTATPTEPDAPEERNPHV